MVDLAAISTRAWRQRGRRRGVMVSEHSRGSSRVCHPIAGGSRSSRRRRRFQHPR
jgi:hypothetical protein